MSQVEYVKVNAVGMTFGRHRKHGDYKMGDVLSVKELTDLSVDKDSIREWIANKTLLKVDGPTEVVVEEIETEVSEILDEILEEEVVEEEVEEEELLREGLTKDEWWNKAKKVGAKRRQCRNPTCENGEDGKPAIHSNKDGLFLCCVGNEEEE